MFKPWMINWYGEEEWRKYHTPGPWKQEKTPDYDIVVYSQSSEPPENGGIALIQDCYDCDGPNVHIADARLIAHSPDLLQVCELWSAADRASYIENAHMPSDLELDEYKQIMAYYSYVSSEHLGKRCSVASDLEETAIILRDLVIAKTRNVDE